MALRKNYSLELTESSATANIKPFVHGLDNGTVTINQNGQEVVLTYNDIAMLEGHVFPEQSYKCVDGVGVKIDNFATLTPEEREYMYSLYPELRPAEVVTE